MRPVWTTIKFLLFASVFVIVSGVLIGSIPTIETMTAEGTVILGQVGPNSNNKLRVMVDNSAYYKLKFPMNPTGKAGGEVDAYFYAYDVGDNTNYVMYVDLTNSDNTVSETFDFDCVYGVWNTGAFIDSVIRDDINSSWSTGEPPEYDIEWNVTSDYSQGAGAVYRYVSLNTGWTAYQPASLGDIVKQIVLSPIYFAGSIVKLGAETIANAAGLGPFVATMNQILTMDFPGIPMMLRVMLAVPIWFVIGYIILIIVRSFLPTIGGGSWG